MTTIIRKRKGSGYRRWGVGLKSKVAVEWLNEDLTFGKARSREAWISRVVTLFQQRVGGGAIHVIARRTLGQGKECWQVGWALREGETDRAFGTDLTRQRARRVVHDVNATVDSFVEQRAVESALEELAIWHGRTASLSSAGRTEQARTVARIRQQIGGWLQRVDTA